MTKAYPEILPVYIAEYPSHTPERRICAALNLPPDRDKVYRRKDYFWSELIDSELLGTQCNTFSMVGYSVLSCCFFK